MTRSTDDVDLGPPFEHDPDFAGPRKNRSCTDIICLLVFMVFIGCWVGIAAYAFSSGDPKTLLTPKDSMGSRCGLDEHVKNKPYLFFFDLTKCLRASVAFTGCQTPQVCVEKCPDEYLFWGDTTTDPLKLLCKYDKRPQSVTDADGLVESNDCAKWYLPSSPFKKRCVPSINMKMFKELAEKLEDMTPEQITSGVKNIKILAQAEQFGQNVVDDLITSWWQILVGLAIGMLACIIYIVLMRWLAAVMVWFSIFGVLALLTASVYFTAKKYAEFKDHPVQESESENLFESYLTKKDTWLTLLIISSIALAIILLILIFLRKRVLLAIALVKEGSKAVGSVTSVLFFPLFPWLLHIGVIAFALAVGLYLTTTGEPMYRVRDLPSSCSCPIPDGVTLYENNAKCIPQDFVKSTCLNESQNCNTAKCKFIGTENPAFYPYLQAFNVIGFLWTAFFVSALGQMILASVFATWYWTYQKSQLPFFAVTEACMTTLRYHIGTLAFGSLIITICRVIRLCLEWIDEKLKKYDNELVKAVLCCCKCFFWCLEKFLKFINRNAYIMCAIHGKNFCASARDAFMLLMRNIVRVFVLDKVTDFLFFLGKLLVTIGVGAIAYVIFATDLTDIDSSALNYNLVPVIAIMIFTYLVATVFFNVYSMAVDTLFLCFLEDCERNDGSAEKPYYMSKNLMKIFGKRNKRD